ncbi:MAG TPA: hypothetical protein VKU42_03625, partial [Candidatus Angelobacter sp.]|nr:hypothetical protein [Candidatus Angelobacter sp.]
MKKLKNRLLPGITSLFLAVCLLFLAVPFAMLAGCGGKMMTAASPTPAPPVASPGTNTTPSNAQTIPNIQTLTGWENCTACTGSALAVYSLTQGVAAPAMSGSSAQFQLLAGT